MHFFQMFVTKVWILSYADVGKVKKKSTKSVFVGLIHKKSELSSELQITWIGSFRLAIWQIDVTFLSASSLIDKKTTPNKV